MPWTPESTLSQCSTSPSWPRGLQEAPPQSRLGCTLTPKCSSLKASPRQAFLLGRGKMLILPAHPARWAKGGVSFEPLPGNGPKPPFQGQLQPPPHPRPAPPGAEPSSPQSSLAQQQPCRARFNWGWLDVRTRGPCAQPAGGGGRLPELPTEEAPD